MNEPVYFDLDDIWTITINFFSECIAWLFSHGFTVFGWSASFGEVAVTVTILYTVFWVFLPWFNASDPGEDWESDDYYE